LGLASVRKRKARIRDVVTAGGFKQFRRATETRSILSLKPTVSFAKAWRVGTGGGSDGSIDP
jgi:hypothetical protein